MSYCRSENGGKDKLIFITRKDQQQTFANTSFQTTDTEENCMYKLTDDGQVDFSQPCLQGILNGPCGSQFRAAFSCFVLSKEETKGADCIDLHDEFDRCTKKHKLSYGEEEIQENTDVKT